MCRLQCHAIPRLSVAYSSVRMLTCAVQGSRPLPLQAHLLTLKQLPDGKLLVRLAHLYQTGEEGSETHGADLCRWVGSS